MPAWLCEPEDAVNGPWMVDAPWTAATERFGFSYYVISKFRVERDYRSMQFVAGDDLEFLGGHGALSAPTCDGQQVRVRDFHLFWFSFGRELLIPVGHLLVLPILAHQQLRTLKERGTAQRQGSSDFKPAISKEKESNRDVRAS